MTNKITRKKFFKYFLWLLLIPFLYAWNSIVDIKIKKGKEKKVISIPNDLPQGVSFVESVILVKTGENLKVFNSSCTHLGCSIKSTEGENFVCPCHGSKYDFNGESVKGPSSKPLEQYSYKLSEDKKHLLIEIG